MEAASPTQMPSQEVAQQNGSAAQTDASMQDSEQPGPCVMKQSVSTVRSHVGPPTQLPGQAGQPMLVASPTQMLSQEVAQQNGSAAHTAAWMQASVQPGAAVAVKQSPGAPQLPGQAGQPMLVASPTQMLSQATAQQNESTAHTAAWMQASVQPGVPEGVKQSPAAVAAAAPGEAGWAASPVAANSIQSIAAAIHDRMPDPTPSLLSLSIMTLLPELFVRLLETQRADRLAAPPAAAD